MSGRNSPTPPTSGASSGKSTDGGSGSCPTPCTITSQTVATSPANRARTRIGVGEEVELTVNPAPATWAITSGGGTLTPNSGNQTTVTYTADDAAGPVTITATGAGCTCSITLTVVQPASVSMERKAGTNLEHTNGWPDCGWLGKQWIHPDDINFYNIERREVDSKSVGTGSYTSFNGNFHGGYTGGFGPWSGVNVHDPAKGSQAAMTDHIYSGYTGSVAVGTAPPFTVGTAHFPIVYQWRVGTGAVHDFPGIRQEHEIFATGRCESRKGGNTEHALYSDPTSTS